MPNKKFIAKICRGLVRLCRTKTIDLLHGWFHFVPAPVKRARGIRVLVYHGVTTQDPHRVNSRFLSIRKFEEHLIALKKHFNVISFEDYVKGNLTDERLNVLITFDDGLKNNFRLALPLLIRHAFPAVFFVTPPQSERQFLFNDLMDVLPHFGPEVLTMNEVSFFKKIKDLHLRYFTADGKTMQSFFQTAPKALRDGVLYQSGLQLMDKDIGDFSEFLHTMSAEEILEISKTPGMVIGCHGTDHLDFSAISPGDLQYELASKEEIERITGKTCSLIAFPYGYYNSRVYEHCRKKGFYYLFGTEKISHPDDKIIPRLTVNPFVSAINQIIFIAKGSYE